MDGVSYSGYSSWQGLGFLDLQQGWTFHLLHLQRALNPWMQRTRMFSSSFSREPGERGEVRSFSHFVAVGFTISMLGKDLASTCWWIVHISVFKISPDIVQSWPHWQMLFPILLCAVRCVYISLICGSAHANTRVFLFAPSLEHLPSVLLSFRGLVPFINTGDVKYLVL